MGVEPWLGAWMWVIRPQSCIPQACGGSQTGSSCGCVVLAAARKLYVIVQCFDFSTSSVCTSPKLKSTNTYLHTQRRSCTFVCMYIHIYSCIYMYKHITHTNLHYQKAWISYIVMRIHYLKFSPMLLWRKEIELNPERGEEFVFKLRILVWWQFSASYCSSKNLCKISFNRIPKDCVGVFKISLNDSWSFLYETQEHLQIVLSYCILCFGKKKLKFSWLPSHELAKLSIIWSI